MNDQKKNIVICDIDGTVANNDHRQHFLEGKKDWDGFFSNLINDKPIHQIINKVKDLESQGNKIAFLTGRPERYRAETKRWLDIYFSFEYLLLMRKDNDRRDKQKIKLEIFENNFTTDQITICFENDLGLIELWKKIKLNVVDINKLIN